MRLCEKMNKKNKTEEIINDKLNNREFTFDEKAWAGVENLLDAQEKKRKRAAFWWFSAAMLLVLVAGASYYYSQKSVVYSPQSVVEKQKDEVSGKKPAVLEQKQQVLAENDIKTDKKATPITFVGHPTTSVGDATTSVGDATTSVGDVITSVASATTLIADAISAETAADSAKTAEKTDSLSLAEGQGEAILTAPGKETKNAWGIDVGVGYWRPYRTTLGATKFEGVIGFTGGIYYSRILHKRWEMGLSAIYSSRVALDFDKTYTNTDFGFGSVNEKTTVSPKTLHYLSVPFNIKFNITQRSHVYMGAAYYQLLATTSKITTTTENSFGEVISSSNNKQTGEHKGFHNYDVALFLGYELTLFERMNAALQVSYGFYDITNDSFQKYDDINLKGTDRNISLQLHLKYDLIRH